MPSCEHIPLNRFHNRDSRLYTENCVRELTGGKEFQRYAHHLEYSERLQMAWFIAPIGLTIAFYYHLLFLLQTTNVPFYVNAPFFFLATTLLFFFIAPYVLIAQFSGFFEPLPRRQAIRLIFFFTLINIAVVSFGGSRFHFPPYLISDPPLPWSTTRFSNIKNFTKITLIRALPLQGSIIAGWFIYEWRQMRWRNAWRVPFPLFSVPIFVGIFTCLWFRVMSLFCFYYIADSNNDNIDNNETSELDVVKTFSIILLIVQQDIINILSARSFPAIFKDVKECYYLWCTTLSLSLLYFLAFFVLPLLRVIDKCVCWLLPTHPTTWSLMFIAGLVWLVTVAGGEDPYLTNLWGPITVLWRLLLNGVTLTP